MTRSSARWRQVAIAAVAATAVVGGGIVAAVGGEEELAAAVPVTECAPGSLTETSIQGRVPAADYESGRAAQGYTCNTEQVGHHGKTGGFKVQRYTDAAGHACAYYDSTRMFPFDVVTNLLNGTGLGVVVLDMTNPAQPRQDRQPDHARDVEPARVAAGQPASAACSPPSWATCSRPRHSRRLRHQPGLPPPAS